MQERFPADFVVRDFKLRHFFWQIQQPLPPNHHGSKLPSSQITVAIHWSGRSGIESSEHPFRLLAPANCSESSFNTAFRKHQQSSFGIGTTGSVGVVLMSSFLRCRTANSFKNTSKHVFFTTSTNAQCAICDGIKREVNPFEKLPALPGLAGSPVGYQPANQGKCGAVSTLIQCSDNSSSTALMISAMNSTRPKNQSSRTAGTTAQIRAIAKETKKTLSRHLESQEQCSRQSIFLAVYDFTQVQKKIHRESPQHTEDHHQSTPNHSTCDW